MDLLTDHPFGSEVCAVFTTRSGGVSKAPYATLNLGLHVGDSAEDVTENRLRVAQTLGVSCVYMNQTHSSVVKLVEAADDKPVDADALVTTTSRLGLAVMTADCLPLLLSSKQGTVVAAVHCGWRGIYGDIIDHTVMKMRELTSEPLLAWIGPCIGPRSFEVGPEVYAYFVEKHAAAEQCFIRLPQAKYLGSLPALVRLELGYLKVNQVSDVGRDTYQDTEHFFSYRRDRVTGRMAGIIFKK
ncbi:MAG: peptidoglycan editing factor PgeF [Succinivibrio sp.]|nr:peptidoglycan editing factor PgeF [Succinivibrio sp.]